MDQQTAGNRTATLGQAHQAALSKFWTFVAIMRFRQGKTTAAEAAQHAITLGAASGVLEAQILGHYAWGLVAVQDNRLAEAQSCYANLQLLFAQAHLLGNPSLLLRNFEWRYYLSLLDYATCLGQYEEAQTYGAAGLQLAQTLGSLRGQITLHLNLIDLHLERGAFAQIQQELAFVLPAVQQMCWRWGECATHYIGSFVHCFFGDYHRALTAGQTALTIVQEIGEAHLEMEILTHLAYLHILLGDNERAEKLLPFQTPQAQQDAPLHLRYSLLIMDVLKAWREGRAPVAYAAATEAWTVAQAFNNRFAQACALVYRGHIQVDLQAWTAASEAYQAALRIFTALDAPAIRMEAQAGLAQLALHQGNLTAAQQYVEALLPLLAAQPCAVTTLSFTYLVCYQVLAANADPRAATVLQQGYAWLQQTATSLADNIRRHFFEAVPSHRALVMAYHK